MIKEIRNVIMNMFLRRLTSSLNKLDFIILNSLEKHYLFFTIKLIVISRLYTCKVKWYDFYLYWCLVITIHFVALLLHRLKTIFIFNLYFVSIKWRPAGQSKLTVKTIKARIVRGTICQTPQNFWRFTWSAL